MTPDQLQHFSDLGLAIGAVLSFALGYMGGDHAMTKRVVAWALFLLVVYVLVKAASGLRNPWEVPIPAPAVLSVLPDQPDGCNKAKGCL